MSIPHQDLFISDFRTFRWERHIYHKFYISHVLVFHSPPRGDRGTKRDCDRVKAIIVLQQIVHEKGSRIELLYLILTLRTLNTRSNRFHSRRRALYCISSIRNLRISAFLLAFAVGDLIFDVYSSFIPIFPFKLVPCTGQRPWT